MKAKIFKTIMVITIVLFYQCSGPKATLVTPGDNELAAAQKRWPTVTKENLTQGYTLFTTRCTKCHSPKNIARRSEKEWMNILDKMAPKAKLTAEEKTALTQYILSKRDILIVRNN